MNFSHSFKVLYGQLKDMKTEIEHVQHLLEKAKVQMQKDFETWWKQQADKVATVKHTHASFCVVHIRTIHMV